MLERFTFARRIGRQVGTKVAIFLMPIFPLFISMLHHFPLALKPFLRQDIYSVSC